MTRHASETAPVGASVGTLAGLLLGLLALDNLVLLRFLGLLPPLGVVALGAAVIAALIGLCRAMPMNLPRVPYRVVGLGFALAVAMLVLGGEGRFFYANVDWQVRDAVLHDLASHAWPFTYAIDGRAYILRAPLGMYLLPSLFGPGQASELALLVSNGLRLGLLIALAWPLFDTRRQRAIALTVFVLFSGWDILGTALYSALGQHPSWDHLEAWNFGFQYSSTATLAFWVPQHATAGWACAVTFLLWRKRAGPIGLFAATIPLVAIWSPLAIIGAVPFALWAGLDVLRRRAFTWRDVVITALALLVALPSLAFLELDAVSVGGGLRTQYSPAVFLFCAALEVLPFVLPLLRRSAAKTVDQPVIWLVLALLLVMPFWQVGVSSDFQMRASIMPIALLILAFASWLAELTNRRQLPKSALAYAIIALGIGAATPTMEVWRAVSNGPSPRPLCSLTGVWTRQDNLVVPISTYLAPVAALPFTLGPGPVIDAAKNPGPCWSRKWVTIRPG